MKKQQQIGRPTKYEPETIKAYLTAISAGLTVELSAQYADVHRDSVHEWMRQDPEFAAARGRVESQLANKWIKQIEAAAAADWRVAAWLLERRVPSEYGKRTHVQAEVTPGGGVMHIQFSAANAFALLEAGHDAADDDPGIVEGSLASSPKALPAPSHNAVKGRRRRQRSANENVV
jgi:hypothetical protein